MGLILPNRNKVDVTFNLVEIIERSVRVPFPNDQIDKVWVSRMSEIIVNLAALVLSERAPHLWKEFQMTKVEGEGQVKVTFYETGDPGIPVSE